MRHELLQMLAAALATLLVVVTIGCAGGGVAVWTGVTPPFDWQFTPDGRRFLLVHNGPKGSTCPMAHPRADCAKPSAEHREFYGYYVTRNGARLLVWVELPE